MLEKAPQSRLIAREAAMKSQWLERWTALLWMHPSDTQLLSLQDGTIPDKRFARTRTHLMRCARCRKRAAQITEDWKSIATLNAAVNPVAVFSEEEMMAHIRASMHAWSAANRAASPAQGMPELVQTDASRQIAAILETYLGRRAALTLLRTSKTTPSSEQVSPAEVWLALRVLLGRKSAAAVGDKLLRIVEHSPKSVGRS
jgi:hypothetical protein